ncbi:MAG: Maf family protein [Myxococcales bacterium]
MAAALVLASASPRRRELLALLGMPFELCRTEVDERPHPGEGAAETVARLARDKALAGLARHPGALVVGADTLVSLPAESASTSEEIFGKPSGSAEAARMLRALAGRAHEVRTGICVASASGERATVALTRVRFRPLSDPEIAWYVATGEPLDKAGAYAIQGRAAAFVQGIEGSWSNVVGLPLAELTALLTEMGAPLPWLASPAR